MLCHDVGPNYLLALQSMLIRGLKVPLLCEFCFSFCVASWEAYKEVSTCAKHTCDAISVFTLNASTNITHAYFCAGVSFCLHPRVNVTTTVTHMQLLSQSALCPAQLESSCAHAFPSCLQPCIGILHEAHTSKKTPSQA